MKPLVVIGLPGNEALVTALARGLNAELGELTVRQFPDGETYVRVGATVWGYSVVLACGLERPDAKTLPLYLTAATLRDQGTQRLILVAPYLAYMRQDKVFHEGEGVSARHYAHWLSSLADGLVTVDPHLHRIHDLGEIYSIPTRVVPAAPVISRWIREHVPNALLIGPDEESRQWVAEVAQSANRPFVVLNKTRRGDRDVDVSVPDVDRWRDHVPVLIDDIISTARTMIETVGHLRRAGLQAPTCIGVHAIFAGQAYDELLAAGATRVVTCNSIAHPTNAIDVHPAIAEAVQGLLSGTTTNQSRGAA